MRKGKWSKIRQRAVQSNEKKADRRRRKIRQREYAEMEREAARKPRIKRNGVEVERS